MDVTSELPEELTVDVPFDVWLRKRLPRHKLYDSLARQLFIAPSAVTYVPALGRLVDNTIYNISSSRVYGIKSRGD